MNAEISLKLFELTQEFIKDKDKAKLFVSKIEETVDKKFENEKDRLATKEDIYKLETNIHKVESNLKTEINTNTKWIVGLIFALALMIIGLYIKK